MAADLITQAQVALRLGDFDLATTATGRGRSGPGSPAVLYTRARLAVLDGDTGLVGAFEAVLAAVPEDAPSSARPRGRHRAGGGDRGRLRARPGAPRGGRRSSNGLQWCRHRGLRLAWPSGPVSREIIVGGETL